MNTLINALTGTIKVQVDIDKASDDADLNVDTQKIVVSISSSVN